jgi:propionate catabolism operon transcriptional regulator
MTKVLFIVPYEDLFSKFYEEVNRFNIENIEVVYDHIYGTDIDKISSINADVIVSRGITAKAVAKAHPDSLVIPIPMSPNDFTEALYSICKDYQGSVGILAATKTMCNPNHIEKLIGRNVEMYIANTQEQVRTGIDELAKKGCKIFLGGLTMSRICEELDLPYVHIKSGRNAINNVVCDALAAARTLGQARLRVGLLTSLLENKDDIIVALDDKGKVVVSNGKADNYFNTKLENTQFNKVCPVKEIYRAIEAGIKSEFVREVNGKLTFITVKPMNNDTDKFGFLIILHKVEDILDLESKVRKELTQKGLVARYTFKDFLTFDENMVRTIDKAKRYSLVDGSIIIIGETGTGKELLAQSIHNASPRRYAPFVAVNCATLTAELLESELFGYVGGSFTGASKEGKIGLFELAYGGSIFLDEIGEMPISLQAKLLRVLQEKEIRKVGGNTVIPIDVRVISATNSELLVKVKENEFRLDLFYRLGLFTIRTIALNKRECDIIPIFNDVYAKSCKKYNKNLCTLSDGAKSLLKKYSWPGNVRELTNSAERLAVLSNSEIVSASELKIFDIIEPLFDEDKIACKKKEYASKELYIMYKNSGLSKGDFANSIGMSRSTLWRKIAQFNC